MNNKKGISAIVATVLIILITVAAVTIIWAAIIPMISNELDGATECFDASAALSVISDFSCYEEGSAAVAESAEGTCADGTGATRVLCEADGGTFTPTTPAVAAGDDIVKIQIARATGDFELLAVDVLGSWEGSADTVTFEKDVGQGVPDQNGAKVYTIVLGAGDDELNLDGVDEASVAARVQAGQTEKLCDGSATTSIRPCS